MGKKKKGVTTVPMNLESVFLKFSAFLTGFSELELQGTGLLNKYFLLVKKEVGVREMKKLLRRFEATSEPAPDQSERLLSIWWVRSIVKMWYLGSWYPNPEESPYGSVIGPVAYQEGLVWKTIEAHPPAAKQPGYGTWSMPPLNPTSNQ